MNRDCKEGDRLCLLFEEHLREWGWFDAYSRAIALTPVGLPIIREFHKQVERAQSALFAARFAYVEHMASCLICSRGLVAPDAIARIRAKLSEKLGENESVPCDIAKGA